MKTYRIIATGRVQGVFFRENTRKQAIELGIRGAVKNLPSGGVEIFAQGDENAIRMLADWCREGPGASRVDDLDITEKDVDEMHGFNIVF